MYTVSTRSYARLHYMTPNTIPVYNAKWLGWGRPDGAPFNPQNASKADNPAGGLASAATKMYVVWYCN